MVASKGSLSNPGPETGIFSSTTDNKAALRCFSAGLAVEL